MFLAGLRVSKSPAITVTITGLPMAAVGVRGAAWELLLFEGWFV